MATIDIILLHHPMHDRTGKEVTTSLTLNDIQDLARSSATFGIRTLYVAHPSPIQRRLAQRLQSHWVEGFGATYNPTRKEALTHLDIVSELDEALAKIDHIDKRMPSLVATSARNGPDRHGYESFRKMLESSSETFLLMFGTGSGMTESLMSRANYVLAPIDGPTPYNHLSVRSASAIILDRLCGKR